MLLEVLDKGGNGRSLLADGHVDTVNGLACLVETLLIDDCVDGDGCLTSLTVADDKLTLSATDRNHRVDRLQSGLQRFLNGLAVDNARSLAVERHLESTCHVNLALAVDGLSERIDDTSEHIVVDTDRSDALGTLYDHALLDALGRTQKHTTHVVLLKVHHDSHSAVLELEKLVGLGVAESVDTGHTIAHLKHSTHLVKLLAVVDALQLFEKHL